MSHTVTVTRTTTTSSTSAILLNVGYFKTIPGILKLIHIILGIIVIGIVGHFINYAYAPRGQQYIGQNSIFTPELFLLLIATTCLITSAILLFSCIVSIATATIIPKTVFEVVYHFVGAILLLIASAFYIGCLEYHIEPRLKPYNRDYKYRLAAGEISFFVPLAFLLFVASINFIYNIAWRNSVDNDNVLREPGYGGKIFSGILALINSVVYGVAAYFAYRNYRSG